MHAHQLLSLEAQEPEKQHGHGGEQVLHQGDGTARLLRLVVGHLADLEHQPSICERGTAAATSTGFLS
jgi:hypothetical protein